MNYETKICSKCGEEKLLSEFHKDKDHIFGVSNKCKNCRSQQRKKYYIKNKNKELKNIKIYHDKNKKYIKIQKQKYKNLNTIMIYGQEFYINSVKDKKLQTIIMSFIALRQIKNKFKELKNAK